MTIFDNIITKENSFTELFRNYMCYKSFRDLFLALANITSTKESIAFEHFTTQQSSNHCRPDIRISTEDIEIFIEIKVWDTYLTDNQPIGYLQELEEINKSYKSLILIVPYGYKYLHEYEQRKEQYPTSINCQTIYWNDIIKIIEQEEINVGHPILDEYLQLLKEWFQAPKIIINNSFLQSMNNKNTPDSILKLTKIINLIEGEITKRGISISKKRSFLEEYGFYVEGDNYSLFIGEWFYFWQKSAYPLCISFKSTDDRLIDLFKNESKNIIARKLTYENKEWLTAGISLDLDFDLNSGNLLNNIHQLIIKLNSTNQLP